MLTLPQLNMANRITKLDTSSPGKRLSAPPGSSQNRQKAHQKSATRIGKTNGTGEVTDAE